MIPPAAKRKPCRIQASSGTLTSSCSAAPLFAPTRGEEEEGREEEKGRGETAVRGVDQEEEGGIEVLPAAVAPAARTCTGGTM